MHRTGQSGFGLYIHWPFCVHKCPYCDFNSRVPTGVNHADWRRVFLLALDYAVHAIPTGRHLSSVFFGGGTPSMMEPATVATVLERAVVSWPFAADVEVTLEANPSDRDRLTDFRVAGVNRLSLGVQALEDSALCLLGRLHDTSQALSAIDMARHIFPKLSLDLIYARPGQTLCAWQRELEWALTLAADHLSLYQLTLEPGTVFFTALASGGLVLPDEDTSADFYQMTQEITTNAGLAAYEVSNHARQGDECRHNLETWQGCDIVGIGPGAHGRLTLSDCPKGMNTIATRQNRLPEVWRARVESATHQTVSYLSREERIEELVMMGLRLTAGIDRARFHNLVGCSLESVINVQALESLAESGLVVLDAASLRVTPAGRIVLDEILRQLLS